MTALGQVAGQATAAAHIRPFMVYRDLGDLAALIETAFGSELALTGSDVVREMRQAALFGPLLRGPGALAMPFTGYVWIEDGRLVGNASIARDERRPSLWIMSNVAVHPAYRRRGIAGALVDRALEHVRAHKGQRVLLQVRAGNEAAHRLYARRGFECYDMLHELSLGRYNWPVSIGSVPLRLRRVRMNDGPSLFALACAVTPHEVLQRRPLQPARFRRGLWWRLGQGVREALGAPRMLEMVAVDDGELVGHAVLMLFGGRRPHELEIRVHPQCRGRWEEALVAALLERAEMRSRKEVRAYVSASHPEALTALQRLGFRELRVLEQMSVEVAAQVDR